MASNASSRYCFANDPSVNVNVSLVKVILEFTNATEVVLTIVDFFKKKCLLLVVHYLNLTLMP